LEFPKQLVIFLEENPVIGDFLEMDIILPNADIITYQVPVLKLWEYDLNNLKRKNLYLLVPFKVFDFRKNIQNIVSGNRPEAEKKRLIAVEFERALATIKEITLIVGDLYYSKEINAYDLEQMLLIINNLTEYLYQRYSDYQEVSLNEEVGKMLTTLINPAILEKGKEEGIKEGKLNVAKKMLAEGMVIPLIAKLTELPEEEILKLKQELTGENH
jgi:predicted transposase/invertase (TIGR01784 family)